MEDIDFTPPETEEVDEDEDLLKDEAGLSFEDIVSFTMMLETGVTIIGITIFFALVLMGVL